MTAKGRKLKIACRFHSSARTEGVPSRVEVGHVVARPSVLSDPSRNKGFEAVISPSSVLRIELAAYSFCATVLTMNR